MSTQTIGIGPTPCEEECAQVGRADYEERSRRECLVFRRMLQRLYPAPDRASLQVKSFAHDFGSYREVCVCYDDEDRAASEYAFRLEEKTPPKWDAIAHYELLWCERKSHCLEAARNGRIAREEIPAQYLAGDFPTLPANQTFTELCRQFPL
ncbi:MAG: hypothetical protein LBE85_11500 [Candidatus Accumulibacter sp.]|jgi:hypothetical protein|nr:hypothetical protein [Accumulibacter sp.]